MRESPGRNRGIPFERGGRNDTLLGRSAIDQKCTRYFAARISRMSSICNNDIQNNAFIANVRCDRTGGRTRRFTRWEYRYAGTVYNAVRNRLKLPETQSVDYFPALLLSINAVIARRMNCWTDKPATAAAARIAAPVSSVGLIVIESRFAFHFAAALFCASDGGI